MRSIALLVLSHLRESAPGAARRRVTFLLAQESNQRSALKCKRTFDRASEPGPLTTPLEVRLEMRSVCAVPYVPPQLRGTGAPVVPPNSLTNTSCPCRASAACLLMPGAVLQMRSACAVPCVPPRLRGTGAAVVANTKRPAALALRRREPCTSDVWGVRQWQIPKGQRLLCVGAKRVRRTVGGYGWRSRTSELRWYSALQRTLTASQA